MAYRLMRSEPDVYGWDHLVRDGGTEWDGVRNYTARNFLKEMKPGFLRLSACLTIEPQIFSPSPRSAMSAFSVSITRSKASCFFSPFSITARRTRPRWG